ncbi:liver stage antigen 3, putative [Perkinsus marinus ATCC 50983]|uniref:Liver stage antigen 3, putative n=1 Tax=Perkinsus marinus (strain ATCC 50983 / TXsc) TaxID=423536 RepID=C5LG51_PERM5|nr:liver stage antigen 3, putative [Perkinsus marinus ATCC 50983]EER04306.1 liver stage antigen 3, putative [Perkinsus marinus ATCC 50983]|eukprot:XP_002772490.1 liver stage antigen 3, putative [Perkinsus marinus ATCC 50983]
MDSLVSHSLERSPLEELSSPLLTRLPHPPPPISSFKRLSRSSRARRSSLSSSIDGESMAQTNECIDLRKELVGEREGRQRAESLVRQLKTQLRESKGKKISSDEKDKKIDRLVRRLSVVVTELGEVRKQAEGKEATQENARKEIANVKQVAARERSQQLQALADLRHASTERIAELTAKCGKLEEAVADEEGRKEEIEKQRERIVAMEIVIESLTQEGKEQMEANRLLRQNMQILEEKLSTVEEEKKKEINVVKSQEAERTNELLERIGVMEGELEEREGRFRVNEEEVKTAKEEVDEMKIELDKVYAELSVLRRQVELEEKRRVAVEERYEKLKAAEMKRLGEVSSLKLELVEVREALALSEAKTESLARELEDAARDGSDDHDHAITPMEMIIDDKEEEEEEALVEPVAFARMDSPRTPGVGVSSSVKRRRRLRRVSAPLLDAAVGNYNNNLIAELKGEVTDITAQLMKTIGQLRASEEGRDSVEAKLERVEMELAEERERIEEMKGEVNTKTRELASLRSTVLDTESTAAREAAKTGVAQQEATEKIRMLEIRLTMQDQTLAAMAEQCDKWRLQSEHSQSQVSARELELNSMGVSLKEWKSRAAELSEDLATAGDSLVNAETNMLDLQFKVSYYETLQCQQEAAVVVARACVVGVLRAAEKERAREAASSAELLRLAECEAARVKEEAAELVVAVEGMRREKEEVEGLRELMLIEEVSRLEICMKEYNKVKVDLDAELEKAMGKIAELEAEIEILRTTGLCAEQRQVLEREIEETNRTLQEALGDLSSTRADLESATEEVGRCHKMMEHFEMKVITAADSGGRQLPQSKRVHYVQHLRREINSLYEENKRLRNERQNFEAQLLMSTRRSSTGQGVPSPAACNSHTPGRTPRKGPIPPRTPRTPMGMAAAELARRKKKTEEAKVNERHRQRLLSERLMLLGRVRGALKKSDASSQSLRTLLENIHDILAAKDATLS